MTLASLALVGVVVLFFLLLGQRSANRELRAMILSDRADALINAGAAEPAEALLEEAGKLDPDLPDLWRRRAVVLMLGGRHFEAITAAEEHLKDHPGDAQVSTLLGAAQIMSRDYDGADRTLSGALQLSPLNRDLVQNLTELRRLQKRPAEAAALIDEYLARNPSDDYFIFKRAMADVAGDLPAERRASVARRSRTTRRPRSYVVAAASISGTANRRRRARNWNRPPHGPACRTCRLCCRTFFTSYMQFAEAPSLRASSPDARSTNAP